MRGSRSPHVKMDGRSGHPTSRLDDFDELLIRLFFSWRPYNLILLRLREMHRIERSMRWLKLQFKRLGLRRRARTGCNDIAVVGACITRELQTSNSLLGYRAMWKCLHDKYSLTIRRDTVMHVLRYLDPEGVRDRASRKLKKRVYFSKGPNFVWHVDQYDKLANFGICIHGCIDGFSRRIIWLHVESTNSNSSVILWYYLHAVGQLKGCPQVLRVDRGTENAAIVRIHAALRMNHTDERAGTRSFIYGSSTSNSRIESWWSRLRRQKTHWWIEKLKLLERDGWYNAANHIHRKCIAMCILPVVRKELEDFVTYWNTHPIRPSSLAACPSGRPDDMFDMPHAYGGENCLQSLNRRIFDYALRQAKQPPSICNTDVELFHSCKVLINHVFGLDLELDLTPTNCFEIYKYLANNIV